ncbi:hypothetical protein D3C75_690480 [compost metagenome]
MVQGDACAVARNSEQGGAAAAVGAGAMAKECHGIMGCAGGGQCPDAEIHEI